MQAPSHKPTLVARLLQDRQAVNAETKYTRRTSSRAFLERIGCWVSRPLRCEVISYEENQPLSTPIQRVFGITPRHHVQCFVGGIFLGGAAYT